MINPGKRTDSPSPIAPDDQNKSAALGRTQDDRDVKLHNPNPELSVKSQQSEAPQKAAYKKSISDRRPSHLPFPGIITRIKNWAVEHGWIKPSIPPNVVVAADLAAQLKGHVGETAKPEAIKDMRGLQLTSLATPDLTELLADAPGVADSKIVIANVDFAGADFTGLNLSGIRFENCNFNHAKMDQCKAYETTFNNCSFGHTTMAKADISDSHFNGCSMNYARMANIILSQTTFASCTTNGRTDLESAAINKCDLTGLPLQDVNMKKVLMVGGKVDTLPLSEKWFDSHLVGVEHRKAFIPADTWGVRSMKFEDMTLMFRGMPENHYTSPSFIPTAKFTGCHFVNSNVTMENDKFICNGCRFKSCKQVALNIYPSYSTLNGNYFFDCTNVSSTTIKKHTQMRDNKFYDCTVDGQLQSHMSHGARGNEFLTQTEKK